MRRRSIGFPLTIGIVLVLLAVTLAVGWQLLVVSDLAPVARGLTAVHWLLLILGGLFSVLIIVGLVLLCAWLVREMRLNQRQQAFLDAVTHEMKTPLASLRLYLDTMLRRDPTPERRQEFLGRMGQDVERLRHTVDQILAAARADERVANPVRERIALAPVLDACVEEVRSHHGLPEACVRLRCDGAPLVWGDATELSLVFRNLLENAVKYSHEPVDVRVRAGVRDDGRVAVEIADRGIGIEREELRKIFQRFYRAGRDAQRRAGLGLGLYVVRSLVRRHGGRVEARSEGSGRGSRFLVTLREAGAGAPALAEPLEAHVQNPGR